jgi:phospholipid/cholesterol/gamma-HCH transport system ATP-binding protein
MKMIRIKDLTKRFNGHTVLDHMNLEIKDSEIIAILGESGVGKSVLLKHIVGIFKPDEGQVLIDDQDITQLSEKELLEIRKSMGYLFQEGALYDFMNVYDNVAFPLREHTDLTEDEIEKRVKDILKDIDLEGTEEKLPSELSGGMKKRVSLARAIIMDSKILFCDEPTSGLDPIHSREIADVIKKVSTKLKCTTILTSHDIPNSFRIADRLALIQNGKIVALGTQSELKQSNDKFVQEFIS